MYIIYCTGKKKHSHDRKMTENAEIGETWCYLQQRAPTLLVIMQIHLSRTLLCITSSRRAVITEIVLTTDIRYIEGN